MTKAIEQTKIRKSPLAEVHSRLSAELVERDGWLVPASYGDVLREYAAVREGGAGLLDLSARGRFRVSGSEAVQFLNGLITNDMKTLAENHWMPAVFPNVQGRLIASVRVIRTQDEPNEKGASPVFLLDTEPATHERVLKTIERFTFAGDFRVNDLTETTALLSVQGRKAASLLAPVLGETAIELPEDGATTIIWQDTEVLIVHATHSGEDGFDLVVAADKAPDLWKAISAERAQPVGFEPQEILRIEAGIPGYGADIDETLVVSEANLDDAVSFTKGCYIGQEIIARIKYRGHVAKKITGVMFEQAVKVESNATARALDDKEIGRLTSVTYSPHLGRTIALTLLKYQYLAAGTAIRISSGEQELQGQVSELPFVKGSWYTS
jgi:folate-binding protein YgfZ